ncbi:ATP-binding protein [Frondihabitans sp. PAMC 28766]|uniref:ATP-binding protein n=1 Tax=Frondihabitans sp. PAMC 28766 TaxID=1795630 RepID=UPI0012FF82E1|nr:ATP-binding protein [Frondihabitans sp. PAMC 28766]
MFLVPADLRSHAGHRPLGAVMGMFGHVGRIVRNNPDEGPSRTITTHLIEQVIARGYAGTAFLFGATSIGPAFTGQPVMNQTWAWVFGLTLFSALTFSAIAGLAIRQVRLAAILVAVPYLLMVVSWPFAATDITRVQPTTPWIWGLCGLAMAAAAVGFNEWVAGIYIFVLSATWVFIRLTPAGGEVGYARAFQDAGYTFLIGTTVLTITMLLRRTATHVDHAYTAATTKYARATKEHEYEKQRNTVDALLHDSVLTTLLQASRADTPQTRRLATQMAFRSLNVIADTEDDFDRHHAPLTATEITDRFEALKTHLSIPVTLTTTGPSDHSIPFTVAEALFAAAEQALVNSAQHAGPTVTFRTITVTWTHTTVTITITDDGKGFDTTQRCDRLGVRVSIIERVETIGGHVTINSHPGHGTRTTLTWTPPTPQNPNNPTTTR